jgi:hypothetical protein
MTITRHLGSWENIVRRSWDDDVKYLEKIAASPKTGYGTLVGYTSTLVYAAVVQPREVWRHVAPLAAAVDRGAARSAAEMVGQRIRLSFLELLDLGNALECSGLTIADATRGIFRDWLARMELDRNDPNMDQVWSAGFAALALDERPTYRRVAARAGEATLPFTAREMFGFNLQALLAHLAAAVENRATLADVTPAWQELLGNYHLLYDTSSIRPGTLLWIARVVHHRIAGAPLGEVGQRLQDDIKQLSVAP